MKKLFNINRTADKGSAATVTPFIYEQLCTTDPSLRLPDRANLSSVGSHGAPATRGREGQKLREPPQSDAHPPQSQEWEREREPEKENESEKEREREREQLGERERPHLDEDTGPVITKMIGFLNATASEDWSLVMEVCERASANESNAKEAAKALRREFKYAEPSAQLSAARLWAIMLRNTSELFLAECLQKKFLDAVMETVQSPRTSPVVRERLTEVVAAAAYTIQGRPDSDSRVSRGGFHGLWRKIKPADKPDEGYPFDAEDTMFKPPIFDPPRPPPPLPHQPRSYSETVPVHNTVVDSTICAVERVAVPPQRPPSTKGEPSRNRVIPVEKGIRRLFQECKVGRGNAQLLTDALRVASPEKLKTNEVINEFYTKCRVCQDFLVASVPWATACAERSGREVDADQQSKGTAEQQLLAALLDTNEELQEALRLYDELEALRVEREIQRRSRKEASDIYTTTHDNRPQSDAMLDPAVVYSQRLYDYLATARAISPSDKLEAVLTASESSTLIVEVRPAGRSTPAPSRRVRNSVVVRIPDSNNYEDPPLRIICQGIGEAGDRRRFETWISVSCLVLYDYDSWSLTGSLISSLIYRFRKEGFGGDLFWIRGGLSMLLENSRWWMFMEISIAEENTSKLEDLDDEPQLDPGPIDLPPSLSIPESAPLSNEPDTPVRLRSSPSPSFLSAGSAVQDSVYSGQAAHAAVAQMYIQESDQRTPRSMPTPLGRILEPGPGSRTPNFTTGSLHDSETLPLPVQRTVRRRSVPLPPTPVVLPSNGQRPDLKPGSRVPDEWPWRASRVDPDPNADERDRNVQPQVVGNLFPTALPPDDDGVYGSGIPGDLRVGANISSPVALVNLNNEFENSPTGADMEIDGTWGSLSGSVPDITHEVELHGEYPVAHGGFGDIWKGLWTRGSSESMVVAVKVLRVYEDDLILEQKLSKRLKRELRIWEILDHPNILNLCGVMYGLSQHPAFVCPWMEKGCLTKYLKTHGQELDTKDRLQILCDAADGLRYLHENNIIHGDLTGANVLIDSEPGRRARLCDFGLSNVIAELKSTTFLTSNVGGAMRWMAPELFFVPDAEDDDNPTPMPQLTFTCDIYSLGSIILETLSGKAPYHYLWNEAQVLLQISKGIKPRRPSGLYVTDELWWLIQECWKDIPIARPSAQYIYARLQTILSNA